MGLRFAHVGWSGNGMPDAPEVDSELLECVREVCLKILVPSYM